MGSHRLPRSSTGRRLALGGVLAATGLLAVPGAAFAGDAPCPDAHDETPVVAAPAEPECDPVVTVTGALPVTVCLDVTADLLGPVVED